MLAKRHGRERWLQWQRLNESVLERSRDHDERASRGEAPPIYHFDHSVLHGDDLAWEPGGLRVPGYALAVDLDMRSPYPDMQED